MSEEPQKPAGDESTGRKKGKKATAPKGPGRYSRPSLGRHETLCKVCNHPQRAEIDTAFLNWGSAYKIAEDYGLADKMNIYRHAHATGLMEKRGRNLIGALDVLIERGLSTAIEIPASATVAAIVARGKMNAQGRYIERQERVDLNSLFEKMSNSELESYAMGGALPEWFEQAVGAVTADHGEQD
jgi:hypothetical protein